LKSVERVLLWIGLIGIYLPRYWSDKDCKGTVVNMGLIAIYLPRYWSDKDCKGTVVNMGLIGIYLPRYWSDKDCKGIVVNRAYRTLPSLHRGSLKLCLQFLQTK